MNIDKKINKIIDLIEREVHPDQITKVVYTVTFHFNKYDNIVRFDKNYIDTIDIKDIEQISSGLLKMFKQSENLIISFNKYGAVYNQK